MNFEWDEAKAFQNKRKHRVSFSEASTAFGDPMHLSMPDPDHSEDETRFLLLGRTFTGRLVVVVFTDRGETTRIISARLASRSERMTYEDG